MKFCHKPLLNLTWKHIRERKRRYCHTIWEVTSGVLVFIMLLLMRQVIKHSHSDQALIIKAIENIDQILYSPNDSMTRQFMSNVTNTLRQKNPHILKDYNKIIAFTDEAEILKYMSNRNNKKNAAVLTFREIDTTSHKLNYTLDVIHTEKVNPSRDSLTTLTLYDRHFNENQDPVSFPVMLLQWNIDRTFLKGASGTEVDHDIEMAEHDSLPALKNISTSTPLVTVKTHMGIIHQFLIFCTMAAPLPFFLYNSSRLVIERRCGLKEMMKIAGVSSNIIRFSHLIDTALVSTVYATLITIILKITDTPILPESNSVIIAFTIILHFLNVTSLAFITSTLSHSYDHANGLALVAYVLSCVLCSICHYNFNSKVQIYIICWFLPHAPVHLFWDEVKHLEKIGEGSTFSNMGFHHRTHPDTICVPVLTSWLMFLVQLVLILVLAWYLDMVRPGKHGVAVKWNFIFKRQYWRPKKKVTFHVTVEQKERVLRDDRYFQKPPLRGPVAIKISQLTKMYGVHSKHPVMALDQITIDAYEGEVTVILGVHDSGKSTLMSIVAGMLSPTSGHVYVKGFDTMSRMGDVRKTLGLCPQHNLTFDYLTVKENIVFFQRINGQTRDTRLNADNLIDRLHLRDHANYFSNQLSASQERCLQVAVALAGGADVLILDEPTAKCDAATRHTLWDVILMFRGDKTVLMTTSSIEEADAIADRIALLNRGKLKCFGTPLFLKNAIGTGVSLSIKLVDNNQVGTIKDILMGMMPEAIFEAEENSLSVMLPCRYREVYPQLFTALETKTQELGIKNLRVGMSMEEMFFRFIYTNDDDLEEHTILVQTFDDVKEVTAWRLFVQRMRVLIVRNFCHVWSVKYKFLILHMMVPVLGLIAISVTANSNSSLRGTGTPGWDTHVHPKTLIIDEGPTRSDNLHKIKMRNPDLTIMRSRSVGKDLKKLTSRRSETEERKNVLGVEMHANYSRLFLATKSQLEASKALNIFSNVLMSLIKPYSFEPIAMASTDNTKIKYFVPKEPILCLIWSMWVAFIITLPLIPFMGLTIHECNSGVHYTHFVVGCPHVLHWLAKIAAQTIIFLLIMPPTVLLCAKFLDFENTFNQDDFLGVLLLAQLMFVPAFLLKLYFLCFFLHEQHAVSLVYIQSIALGFLGPIIQIFLEELSEVSYWYRVPMIFLTFLGRFSPVFTLSELIAKFTTTARVRAYCKHNEKFCDAVLPKDYNSKMLIQVCCGPKRFDYQYLKGAFMEIVVLTLHLFLYSALLVAVQKNWIQNLYERIANYDYVETSTPVYRDINVYNEKTATRRMMRCIKSPADCYGEEPSHKMLLVDNLHKQYTTMCCKRQKLNRNPVRGISFFVKAGESLVLLGQAESGKTATLLMIAGSTPVTRGDCFLDGKLLRKERSKYLQKVSFTKSTGGLDEFYSGYQNLKILSLLHGHHVRQAETFAVSCMGYMGLNECLHQPVSTYTRARRRRLALCAALLAAPRAVLADEPMHALNPYARRCVARAFASLVRAGSALVVAEHSLDWTTLDSLYTSVAILSKGRIVAKGSCNYIRDMLANGHTARIKIKLKSIRTYVYEGSSESSDSEDLYPDRPDVRLRSTISGPVKRENASENKQPDNARAPLDVKQSSDEDDESIPNTPSLGSKLERALIDISRGNISLMTQEKKKTREKRKKPRSEKSRDKFRSESKSNFSSSSSGGYQSVSFDSLATGVKKAVLRRLIADFLVNFPNSELIDEHLPMLYFHIRADQEDTMPYSVMFSKLETLRNSYRDIVEDYSLSELTVEDVYCQLAKEPI